MLNCWNSNASTRPKNYVFGAAVVFFPTVTVALDYIALHNVHCCVWHNWESVTTVNQRTLTFTGD